MQENSICMVETHGHTMAHAKHGEPSKEKKVNFNVWLEWEHMDTLWLTPNMVNPVKKRK